MYGEPIIVDTPWRKPRTLTSTTSRNNYEGNARKSRGLIVSSGNQHRNEIRSSGVACDRSQSNEAKQD